MVFKQHLGALHFEASVENLQGDFLVGREGIEVLHDKVVFAEKLSLDLFDELLETVDREVLLLVLGSVAVFHGHHLDDFGQGEAVLQQVLLIPVHFDNDVTETLQVLLLLLLAECNLVLDQVPGQVRAALNDGVE